MPVPEVDVLLVMSFSEKQRNALLSKAKCLVYTPSNEHFGIVPVEAMYCGVPVVAVRSGGPMESIIDGRTGYLVDATVDAMAVAVGSIISAKDSAFAAMKEAAKKHVASTFSLEKFAESLNSAICSTE